MSEWWTYRLGDFLLFSERVYWRLFELHNAAWWPLPPLALALGALTIVLAWRPRPWSDRAVALTLALAWLFVAYAFLWQRYAPVNWAARYVAPAFALQAAALVWFGALRGRLAFRLGPDGGRRLGAALLVYALVVHPLWAPAAGRPLAAAEVFALAPDPTAMATLGLLAMARVRGWPRTLLVVPILWCVVSGLTLQTLGSPQAWACFLAVVLALLAQAPLGPARRDR